MDPVDKEKMARHIADSLDGDWDDGLEAFVEVTTSRGNGFHVTLKGDGGERLGSFRIIVEQIS
jgi:hypothetical protein